MYLDYAWTKFHLKSLCNIVTKVFPVLPLSSDNNAPLQWTWNPVHNSTMHIKNRTCELYRLNTSHEDFHSKTVQKTAQTKSFFLTEIFFQHTCCRYQTLLNTSYECTRPRVTRNQYEVLLVDNETPSVLQHLSRRFYLTSKPIPYLCR